MSSITANEYRTAAKVDRFHGGQSAAQFYEDNARALESEDLVTQVAMQFAGSTWGGRDAEEQFALAGSERALAYLVGAGRLIPAGGMALTAEQVEDVRAAREGLRGYRNFEGSIARGHVRSLIAAVDALFSATGPAEARCTFYAQTEHGDIQCELPDGHAAHHRIDLTPAEPAEEETKAERRDPDELAKRMALIWEGGWDEFDEKERDYLRCAAEIARAYYASSPVVPAPTETGPWPSLKDVPAEVSEVRDVGKNLWRRKGGNWEWKTADGRWFEVFNPRAADDCAPFVAAEEG